MNKTVILKVTSSCNLNCVYCYEDCSNFKGKNIPLDLLKKFLNELIASLQGKDSLRLIWHGGEPLLMGVDFYKEVDDFISYSISEKDIQIQNSIQTNGVLLDQRYIDFFLDKDFRIGFSLDGPKCIHDKHRKDNKGLGSFERVMAAITKWQTQKKDRNSNPISALAVISKITLGDKEKFYDFFSSHNINVKINPMLPVGNALNHLQEYEITSDEYADFLMYLWRMWIGEDNPEFQIQPFVSIIESILETKPKLCTFMGKCGIDFLSIDVDGNIFPCGRWNGVENSWGNIGTASLVDILNSNERNSFVRELSIIPEDCQHCKYYSVCHSGCSANRYFLNGSCRVKTGNCRAYRSIFSMAEEFIDQGFSVLEDCNVKCQE